MHPRPLNLLVFLVLCILWIWWIRRCGYASVTDTSTHALVGYGGHGKNQCIQDLFCQTCKTKFTVRRDTPLYRLKTPAQRVGEVLSALAEGLDVAAGVRVFGHYRSDHPTMVDSGRDACRAHARLLLSRPSPAARAVG